AQSGHARPMQLPNMVSRQTCVPDFVQQIVAALGDNDSAGQAAEYLVELGPSAAGALVSQLSSRDADMRVRAAGILGLIGGPAVPPALEAARQARDPAVAAAAEAAGGRNKAGRPEPAARRAGK